MLPERVVYELSGLEASVIRYCSLAHPKCRTNSRVLASSIIKAFNKPGRADVNEMLEVLWKHCQYGPFDALRRLFSNYTHEIIETISEAIGYQVTIMSMTGGLQFKLLSELGLPFMEPPQSRSIDARTCAMNAVHLGDLFRYMSGCGEKRHIPSAIACYKSAVEWCPEFGLAWNQLGVVYSRENSMQLCVYYYTKAMSVADPFPAAKSNLIGCLRNCDRQSIQSDEHLRLVYDFLVCKKRSKELSGVSTMTIEQQFVLDYIKREGECQRDPGNE